MPPAQDYNQTYEDAGAAWNIDPSLLRAIIKGESGSQGSAATSYKGAEGMAQFMPATARSIGMTDTRDPEQSIWGAAKLMSQNLDAAKGDVPTALKIYQGGPDRSKWGPQNAAYPAYIMSKYKAAAPANDAVALAPAAAPAQPSGFDAAYGKGSSTTPAPAPVTTTAPQPSGFDAAYGPGSAPAATEAPAPAKTGILANMAAGLGDGAKMGLNVLSDPFGNLVGKPLATAAVFGHDALAPVFGYNRFSPETRDMLLGDNVPQPGTRMVDAAAEAAGVNLAGIQPQTPLEAIARGATGGLVGGGILGGANRLTALMGAAGGATGAAAEQAAPDWAKPAAGLAGNIVGGGAAALASGRLSMPNRLTAAAEAEPAAAARVEPRLNSAGPAPAEPVTPGSAAPGQGPSAGMGGPTPGMGAPAPNSMGAAATPAEMAVMSDRELAAYKAKADMQRLINPVKPGDDPTVYVPGSTPSAAARMGNADLAVQHKLAEQTPGNKQRFVELDAKNNEARVEHYQELAGDPVITNSLAEAKNAAFDTQVKGALANAKPVDIAPIATEIDGMLNGPTGKQTAVAREISGIKSKLYDAKGNLETDPNMLYGIRKEINDRLSKEAGSADATSRLAQSQLLHIKGMLDDAIETGAPGFKEGIANFSDAMRPIEAQQLLLREMPNLFNANGNGVISPAKYSAFMKRVFNQQNETTGANPYKSLSDETTNKLYDLHSDLQREARVDTLAKTGTSQTSLLTRGAAAAAEGGAHIAALASPFPFVANMGVKMAKEGIANYRLKGKTNRLLDGMNYAPLPP